MSGGGYLKIGDIVTIVSQEHSGYLQNNGVAVDRFGLRLMKNDQPPRYLQEGLFEIVSQFQYNAKRDLEKFIKSNKHQSSNSHDEDTAKLLHALETSASKEMELNEEKNDDRIGMKVAYGDIIQLRHVLTDDFLTVNTRTLAEIDKEASKICLDSTGSTASYLKILPRFKLRQEGDFVFVQDQIIIVSSKDNAGLCVTKEPYSTLEPRFLEVCCTPAKISSWKFQIFTPHIPQAIIDTEVVAGRTFRLFHPETTGFVASPTDVHMDDSKEKDKYKAYIYRSASSSIPDLIMHSKALWVMETKEAVIGGTLSWGNIVRFRCANTGFYLAIDTTGVTQFTPETVCPAIVTSNRLSPECEFKVFPTLAVEDDDSVIPLRASVKIKHAGSGMTLHCNGRVKHEKPPGAVLTRSKARRNLCIEFHNSSNKDEDALFILPTSDDQVDDAAKCASYARFLCMFYEAYSQNKFFTREESDRLIKMISDVIFFLTDTVDSNALTCRGIPIPSCQDLARELKLIDIMILLIQCPFTFNKDKFPNIAALKTGDPQMFTILTYLYKAMWHSFEGMRRNEFYIAGHKWLTTFIDHLGASCGAEDVLSNILTNNRTLLDQQVNPELIDYFLRFVHTRGYLRDYFGFLTSLCSCLDEPVPVNQVRVLEAVWLKPENKKILIRTLLDDFPGSKIWRNYQTTKQAAAITHGIMNSHGDFEGKEPREKGFNFILCQWDAPIPMFEMKNLGYPADRLVIREGKQYVYLVEMVLPLLEPNPLAKEGSPAWCRERIAEFYVAQMQLYSEMCLGRSYTCIERLREEFSFNLLYTAITNEKIPASLRAPYTRMILNTYVDCAPLQSLTIPQYTRDYSSADDSSIKLIRNQDPSKFQVLEELICDHFVHLKGCQVAAHVDENLFTLALLRLLTVLAESGNFSDLEEISAVLQPLINTLDGRNDKIGDSHITDGPKKKKKGHKAAKSALKSALKKDGGDAAAGTAAGVGDRGSVRMKVDKVSKASTNSHHQSMEVTKQITAPSNEVELSELGKPSTSNVGFSVDGTVTTSEGELAVESVHIFDPEDPALRLQQNEKTLIIFKGKIEMCKTLVTFTDVRTDYQLSALVARFKAAAESGGEFTFSDVKNILESKESRRLDLDLISPDTPLDIVLPDLIMYESHELVHYCFTLMLNHYSKLRTLMDSSTQTTLLTSTDDVNVCRQIENSLAILRNSMEKYDVWGVTNSKYGSYDASQLTLVLDNLKGLIALCSSEDPNITYRNQMLLANIRAQLIILRILRMDYHGNDADKNLKEIFIKCLEFLRVLVLDNPKLQKILLHHIDQIQTLIEFDIGAENVISAIFHNNIKLCLVCPEELIQLVVGINERSMRPELLKFLCTLSITEQGPVKRNQDLILSMLTDISLKNTLLLCNEPGSELYKQRQSWLQNGDLNDPDSKLTYNLSVLQCLAFLTKGKNHRAEAKCQNLYPIRHLLQAILENAIKEEYITFNMALASFLYEVYLDTEIRVSNLQSIPQIWMVFDIYHATLSKVKWDVKDFGGASKEFRKYCIHFIIPCFHAFFANYYDSTNAGDEEIEKLSQYIAVVRKMANSPFLKSEHRASLIKCLGKMGEASTASTASTVDDNGVGAMAGGAGVVNDTGDESTVGDGGEDKVATPGQFSQQGIEAVFLQKMDQLRKDEVTKKDVEEEFDMMVKVIRNVTTTFENDKGCPIKHTTEGVVCKLIQYVQTNLFLHNASEYDVNNIAVCKMMRRMIEMLQAELTGGEGDIEDLPDEKLDQLRSLQTNLSTWGALKLIGTIISLSESLELQDEAVSLGIALLSPGNSEVQKLLFQYFKENPDLEFFLRLRVILRKCGTDIKEKRKMQKRQITARLSRISTSSAELNSAVSVEERSRKLLRFIQLCFEGHNLDMQNYFRHQNTARNSFDIITEISNFFLAFDKKITSDAVECVMQLFDTLTESLQGPCANNQLLLASSSIVTAISRNMVQLKDLDPVQSQAVKLAMLKTLMALLESRHDGIIEAQLVATLSPYLLKGELQLVFTMYKELKKKLFGDDKNNLLMMATGGVTGAIKFGFSGLEKTATGFVGVVLNPQEAARRAAEAALNPLGAIQDLASHVAGWFDEDQDKLKELYEIAKEEGYILYSLIRSLEMASKTFENRCAPGTEEEAQMFQFYSAKTANVQVMWNGNIEVLYFPIPDMCSTLTEKTKEQLIWNVDRTSIETKLVDFVDRCHDIYGVLLHQERMLNYSVFRFLFPRLDAIKTLNFILMLTINLVLCVSLFRPQEDLAIYDQETFAKGHTSLPPPKFRWTAADDISYAQSSLQIIVTFVVFIMSMLTDGYLAQGEKMRIYDKQHVDDIYSWKPVRTFHSVLYAVLEKQTLWYFMYFVIAVLGIKYYYFTSLQLLDLLNRSEALQNVVRSVTKPIKELSLTFLMLIFMLFIFAMFNFYFLAPMNNTYDGTVTPLCLTLYGCFVHSLDAGFLNGGGVGESMTRFNYNSPLWIPQLIFVLACFFLIIVLGLNIVFGIIIDTFGALREDYNNKVADMNTVCFICGLQSDIFDRREPSGFRKHTTNEHFLWSYFYFYVHCMTKSPSDMTGAEDYAKSMIDANNISWFPIRRALSLKGTGVEGSGDVVEANEDRLEKEMNEKMSEMMSQLGLMRKMLLALQSDGKSNFNGNSNTSN